MNSTSSMRFAIGMVHVLETTSGALTTVIKDVLIRCILQINLCRGQTFKTVQLTKYATYQVWQSDCRMKSLCHQSALSSSEFKSLQLYRTQQRNANQSDMLSTTSWSYQN